jgi:hypothetical protein
MTIKQIINEFEKQQQLFYTLFKSFNSGEEYRWAEKQDIVYPNIYSCYPSISNQTNDSVVYKFVIIFTDRSFEGGETDLAMRSRLDTAVLIYINDFISNYIEANNLPFTMTNPSYLHYQEQGNDRSYKIRAEFNVIMPITVCSNIKLFQPSCP